MPGHNYFESINKDGVLQTGGKVFQIGAFGNITNSSGAIPAAQSGVDYQGYAPGAFLINTSATTNKTTTTVYINLGTTTTATWTALTVS
jgi:hypothetical protein